jgi:hypothetical protein
VNLALKLSKDVKDRLAELEALSDKARDSDKEAMRELRQALRESSPEIVARASDFARLGRRVLAETIAASEPLMEEALVTRLELMHAEVAGENPTPLDVLITERIVSTWLVVEVLEALMNAQLKRGESVPHAPTSYLKFIIGWLESANRRYLSSIRGLARVRKLQNNTPDVQFNTQINVATPTGGRRGEEPNC